MGVAQMEQLDHYIAAKRAIAARYREGLRDVSGLAWSEVAEWGASTFWLSTVLVDADAYGIDSRALLVRLQEANIQSRPLWHPLYRLRPFKECVAYQIEVADRLYRDGLSLPSSVGLKQQDQEYIIGAIHRAVA